MEKQANNDAIDYAALQAARVDALPQARKQGVAAHALSKVVTKALEDAAGDVRVVDWNQVHQAVFDHTDHPMGQGKLPIADVLVALKAHSPGAVTPEEIAAVEAMGEVLAQEADFSEIFDDAYQGLREYYPSHLTSAARASVRSAVRASHISEGPSQARYVKLRDAIEAHVATLLLNESDGHAATRDARVEALPPLQKQAGAAYTLYQVAAKALQGAAGDASAVNWVQVHRDVYDKAVNQDKQPIDAVLAAIKTHSPGSVTDEQVAEIDAMGNSRYVPEFVEHYRALQETHAQFAAGAITSFEHANRRQSSLIGALQAVAKSMGTTLATPMRIDSRGEISIVALHPDGREPKYGCGKYGEAFAKLMSGHGPRTGIAPMASIDGAQGWCSMHHFGVEKMLNEFAASLPEIAAPQPSELGPRP